MLRANPGQPEKLEKAIIDAMQLKPWSHNFSVNDEVQVVRFMNMTGDRKDRRTGTQSVAKQMWDL